MAEAERWGVEGVGGGGKRKARTRAAGGEMLCSHVEKYIMEVNHRIVVMQLLYTSAQQLPDVNK